jgi:hypothetical protein
MMALNVDLEVLRSAFHYIGPNEKLYDQTPLEINGVWYNTRSTKKSLQRAFMSINGSIGLVVLDGMNQALANQAGKTASSEDVADFYRELPRRLTKEEHCAVVIVDHLTKDASNNRYAFGSMQKLAAIDGASFLVDLKQPFGRGGMDGLVEVSVTKDRPGYLRSNAVRSSNDVQRIADFHLHSYKDLDTIDLELVPPDTTIGKKLAEIWALKVLLYEAIEQHPGMTTREVRAVGVGHSMAAISIALDQMAKDGNITITGKRPKIHSAVTPPVPNPLDLL